MEIKALEALIAVAETGNFHTAARRLNVTQPAISHQIRKLEQELGETLIVRAKPKVYISPAGQRVLDAAERIAAEVAELRQYFASADDREPQGVLRVAASTLGIVYLVGNLLERFIAANPQIELIVTATETPIEGVRQHLRGRVDVAFAPFPLNAPSLEATILGTAEHVIIARPDHPLVRDDTVSIEALRGNAFVRYQTDAGSRHASDRLFLADGDYPPILMESNDTEFIKRIVGLGLGVALVPSFTVVDEIREQRLRMVQVANFAFSQDFGLVHLKSYRLRTLEVFKRFCQQNRSEIPIARAT